MEFWDVYDKNRRPKGTKIMRGGGRRLAKGEYHLTAHVCVFSGDGRMLIQRRIDSKPLWGGLWDITAGGSVLAGENTAAGAERELFEEMGIRVNFSVLNPSMTFYHDECISDYYVVHADVIPSELELQQTEVSDARYATREEVLDMLDGGAFVPYRKGFIELLFDLAESRKLFDL